MPNVACFSPFIPPEWAAAHGCRPMPPLRIASSPSVAAHRGVCPCAGGLADLVLQDEFDAVVLPTTCDQMRYAAALLRERTDTPVFLMNIPSTHAGDDVRGLYASELRRLGRFLTRLSGVAPDEDAIIDAFSRYDAARATLRDRPCMESSAAYRERLEAMQEGRPLGSSSDAEQDDRIPLAIIGGPLLEEDWPLIDMVRELGGRIVLDGSEFGERTVPAPLDLELSRRYPATALTKAYFDTIPDVFQRPNDRLHAWRRERFARRGVRGVLLRRRIFCDLWHAEVHRLRETSLAPVLDLDAAHNDDLGASSRTVGRVEAFLETLR